MVKKLLWVVGLLCALSGLASADDGVTLKMATLAPKGSAWAKILEKGAKDIDTKTSGRVKVKWFFSGQQGDERDVVRKMTSGNLDGSALTAVGLGLIKSDVLVLQLPFLFTNDQQVDYVRDAMKADFENEFDSAGYVLLAWGDVGWVHLYSNVQLNSKADLKSTKMWAWVDDPITRALFAALGVNGVPLGVPQVLPNLQTGAIDACYGAPLATVALQWYTKIKYAADLRLSYSIGALVVRKDVFSKLSAADQQVIIVASQAMGKDLIKTIRKDNGRARKAMEKSGVTFAAVPQALVTDLQTEGQKLWQGLVGKLYDQKLLDKVLAQRTAAIKKYPKP